MRLLKESSRFFSVEAVALPNLRVRHCEGAIRARAVKKGVRSVRASLGARLAGPEARNRSVRSTVYAIVVRLLDAFTCYDS